MYFQSISKCCWTGMLCAGRFLKMFSFECLSICACTQWVELCLALEMRQGLAEQLPQRHRCSVPCSHLGVRHTGMQRGRQTLWPQFFHLIYMQFLWLTCPLIICSFLRVSTPVDSFFSHFSYFNLYTCTSIKAFYFFIQMPIFTTQPSLCCFDVLASGSSSCDSSEQPNPPQHLVCSAHEQHPPSQHATGNPLMHCHQG